MILWYSNNWHNHVANLREFFKRFSYASWTINVVKCDLGKATIASELYYILFCHINKVHHSIHTFTL